MASPLSGKAGRNAANIAAGSLNAGLNNAKDALTTGANDATGYLTDAGALFDPMISSGNAGLKLYTDATGANGAAGQAAATSAFRTDPGYQFQQQQGLDALMRTANSRGMLAGGNTSVDALKFSQGLADQGYQKWLSNLQPLMQQGALGATGQAGTLTGLAQNANNLGTNTASLEYGYGKDVGQIQAGGMMAGQQAAANRTGALMQGLQLGSQLLGGAMGGMGGLSGIGGGISSAMNGGGLSSLFGGGRGGLY